MVPHLKIQASCCFFGEGGRAKFPYIHHTLFCSPSRGGGGRGRVMRMDHFWRFGAHQLLFFSIRFGAHQLLDSFFFFRFFSAHTSSLRRLHRRWISSRWTSRGGSFSLMNLDVYMLVNGRAPNVRVRTGRRPSARAPKPPTVAVRPLAFGPPADRCTPATPADQCTSRLVVTSSAEASGLSVRKRCTTCTVRRCAST